ncbi:MAG: SulP family inorganic anion transporter [Alphaproteobacteria bacterium]|nr:SulP family inorganic anion transporter [Alphaproteobacteria bacterium]
MKKIDLIAGLSVAGLLLPEAVAYAAIAGLPPQRAIFAGIAGCLAYAAFGKSRFAIVSPTSSSAAILAAILASMPVAAGQKAELATAAILLTGFFFLLAAAARLGNLTGLIARPVLRGFAFGLAINIIVKQLPAITGYSLSASNIFALAGGLLTHVSAWNIYSLTSGVLALACLLLLRRLPALPGAFITLAAGIAASMLFDLPGHGVATVGVIDRSLAWPSLPQFELDQWSRLAQLTLPLAMILFAESWGTVSALALRHGEELEANTELAAFGIANFASALAQGMPVGAGFSAGSASEAAGAASRLTAAIAATGLAILLAFATPLVARLPEPVLAAVVVAALTHALNLAPFFKLAQLKRDLFLSLAAAAAVLAFGVLNGMLIAVALSIALVIQRLAHPRVVRLGRLGETRDYVDVSRHGDARQLPGIAIWRPSVPLLFANADGIFHYIQEQTLMQPDVRAIIVSLEETFDLDSTSFEVIAAFDAAMSKAGKHLLLARVHDHVRDVLLAGGLTSLISRCSYSVDDAVAEARAS